MRVTKTFLQAQIDRLNALTNSPAQPYVKQPDGTHRAQIGCWHLSQAYGGYALHRMSTPGGGVSDPFGYHMPARELSDRISAYIRALHDVQHGHVQLT